MSGHEIRRLFLDYFAQRGHRIVASGSLVPQDDPSLLFTNAGMVPFKKVFLGQEARNYRRAVTCQKSFRASGKHNDLENVGYTPRHHTFFEMLGNFSFGDYFKKDAIAFAWDLLTSGYKLPVDKLWVSVHHSDDEAYDLWQSEAGVAAERIVRLGDHDNFWAMGDTGPCGPCSEIHIDLGREYGCGKADCAVGCDCPRYLELWNLVFMQFNRDQQGVLHPLPKPSIDTGMGLERVAAVIQGKFSNYDSDIFSPIINYISRLCGIAYGHNPETDISLRVVADHARACAFLIGDGVLPSNEGRGYVLRRILRRAARHGRKLGLSKPFLHQVTMEVIAGMSGFYPELNDSKAFIDKVAAAEEERFGETLDSGLKVLTETIASLKAAGKEQLPGADAFKLYDTFGFPLDLTMTIVREEGLSVDEEGFESAMGAQKSRSRASWKGSGGEELPPALRDLRASGFKSAFVGYEELEANGEIAMIMRDQQLSAVLEEGQRGVIITDRSPFYGAAGGQMGDCGLICGHGGQALVEDTTRPGGDLIAHQVKVTSGKLSAGLKVLLTVDKERRQAVRANHSATHLLHAALRQVLGEHVKQAGSLVEDTGLRFDFSHFSAMSAEQISAVELLVNQGIWANVEAHTQIMGLEEAVRGGAVALFEERYGEQVRVVSLGDISKELCGGLHVRRSGDIGFFRITGESSVAAGVRRIEAVTRKPALELSQAQARRLADLAGLLKAGDSELGERVKRLLSQIRENDKEIDALKTRLAQGGGGGFDLMSKVEQLNGFKRLIALVEADEPRQLREAADNLRARLASGVVLLGARNGEGKALLLAMVSKDLTGRFHAGDILRQLAPLVGGGGGGRPDLAQAGGCKGQDLELALQRAAEIIK
jgi:alanyl-tRNA synthetase